MSAAFRKWVSFEHVVDVLVVFTAIGMTFLIVFALLANAERSSQIQQQLRESQRVVRTIEAQAEANGRAVRKSREDALRYHCATAQLGAREDGKVTKDEAKLLGLICHS